MTTGPRDDLSHAFLMPPTLKLAPIGFVFTNLDRLGDSVNLKLIRSKSIAHEFVVSESLTDGVLTATMYTHHRVVELNATGCGFRD